MNKFAGIMNHVNISELLTIIANRIPHTANFEVSIIPLDPHKRLVFDPSALAKMNQMITEKASHFEARDPRVKLYIEEFVSRLLPEFQRTNLISYEDIPEGVTDHYKDIRTKYKGV